MGDVKVLGAGVQRFRKPWVKFSFVDLLREKKQIETIIFFHLFLKLSDGFCDGLVQQLFVVAGAAAVEVFLGAGRWSWAPYGAPEGVREAGGGDPDGRRGGR